jgi:hypothetical protein
LLELGLSAQNEGEDYFTSLLQRSEEMKRLCLQGRRRAMLLLPSHTPRNSHSKGSNPPHGASGAKTASQAAA